MDYILKHQINNYKTDGTAKYDYVGQLKKCGKMKIIEEEILKQDWGKNTHKKP